MLTNIVFFWVFRFHRFVLIWEFKNNPFIRERMKRVFFLFLFIFISFCEEIEIIRLVNERYENIEFSRIPSRRKTRRIITEKFNHFFINCIYDWHSNHFVLFYEQKENLFNSFFVQLKKGWMKWFFSFESKQWILIEMCVLEQFDFVYFCGIFFHFILFYSFILSFENVSFCYKKNYQMSTILYF